jgi:hypothetical protein
MQVGVKEFVKIAGRIALILSLSKQHRCPGNVGDGAERIRCTFDEASRSLGITRANHTDQQRGGIDAFLQQLLANLLDLPGARHGSGDSPAGTKNGLCDADADRIGSASQQQDESRVSHSSFGLERNLA